MIAYQGAGRVLDAEEIRGLADWATRGLVPDLTVVLDVSVDRALGEKVDLDRLEAAGTEFHERVRSYFLDLAARDPSRYLVIAGRQDRDTIEAAIRERVQTLLA
jgi:dTMP kinase